ncbi:tetratricopeptide repeat protein [Streptomyces sp. NPDC005407]|uniref:tetratricopeptide repeat protein n=1 Tax=Streptomyces sp. NPDC005407 TaxID=3155340 RepID=UPI0033ADEFAB
MALWKRRSDRKKEQLPKAPRYDIEMGPWDAVLWLAAGQVDAGQVTSAEDNFRQVMESGDAASGPIGAFNLGILLERRGELTGAEDAYRRGLESGHRDVAAMCGINLGLLLKRHSDIQGAEECLQAAIETGHADHAPRAMVELGAVALENSRFEAAESALREALATGHPDEAHRATFHLGRVLVGRGDLDGGQECHQRILDAERNEFTAGGAHYSMGEIQAMRGDTTAALQSYIAAAELGEEQIKNLAHEAVRQLR